MAATALAERYASNLHGVLLCCDRIIVTGTLPGACCAGGMTSFLYAKGVRIFDDPRFAEPLRWRIRLHKSSGHVFLRPGQGKCLHCCFYFVDEEFGLCRLRVPTWAPFGLQFRCNGHSALARSLSREGIEFAQEDDACPRITDLERAQTLADAFNPAQLHRRLKRYAHGLRPVADVFAQDDRHRSIPQAEYATGLMFRSREIVVPLYDSPPRQAVLAADAPRVAGIPGIAPTPPCL